MSSDRPSRFSDWIRTSVWLLRHPRRNLTMFPNPPIPDLSTVEWDVLQALVDHVAPVAIAERMGVNLGRVRMNIQSIRTKYELPDIRITVRLARRYGMPPRPQSSGQPSNRPY